MEGGACGPSRAQKYTPKIEILEPSKFHAKRPTFILEPPRTHMRPTHRRGVALRRGGS